MNAVDAVVVERLATGWHKPISEPRRFALLVLGAFCSQWVLWFRILSCRTPLSMTILALATLLFPLGTLLLALTFRGIIVGSVVRLSVFNAIMNLGCILLDLGTVMTVITLFPVNRGPVVASMKTFAGLGSVIVGCIQVAFFLGKTEQYFYFLMALVFVVGGACLVFLRLPSYHLTGYEEKHLSAEEKERRLARKAVYLRQKPPTIRFGIGLGFVLVLIIFLPMQGALVAYKGLGQKYRIAFAAVVIALMVFYPTMALPLRSLERKETDCNSVSEPVDEPKKDNTEVTDVEKPEAVVETDLDYIAPQYQTTFFQNLRTPKMWALVWSYFCIVGSEFVIIFNARFIFAALSGEKVSDELGTLLTVLNGVGSAVGRLLMSYFEIWTQKRKAEDRIPITLSLFFPVTCVMLSMIFFLVLPKAALPLPYVLAAMGNGFCAAVIVLVVRTILAKDPGKHYNFCFVGTVLSILFLNRLLYGEWYTRQAERCGVTVCLEKSCVLMPLLFLLGVACTAFLSNLYVHFEYRRFCQRMLEERQRVRDAAVGSESFPDTMMENVPRDDMSPQN
ncbi:hypothetical protein LSM04_001095 [Trypanosoma melophagium]|uniref:uncharacterized protein n=1 Tax=Trypanosoma melophagium TaxID=715481 RepID=UPI00351A0373|nr:hypothetical protein LSM04_001095 [Trypanosoma melophagium]